MWHLFCRFCVYTFIGSYVYIQDRYAKKNGAPLLDQHQDWELISGNETGEFTVLKFSRKLVTCDEEDNDITVRGHFTLKANLMLRQTFGIYQVIACAKSSRQCSIRDGRIVTSLFRFVWSCTFYIAKKKREKKS